MKDPRDLWTWILVSIVTLLIWSWAASETKVARDIPMRVQFAVPGTEEWLMTPDSLLVTVSAEGSQSAVRQAEETAQQLEVALAASGGRQTVDLRRQLAEHAVIRDSGITIVSVDPPTIPIDLDRFERIEVPVRIELPGVQTEGLIEADPPRVMLTLPSRLRQIYLDSLYVVAPVPRQELDRLERGVRQTLENRLLRVPEQLRANVDSIRMTPPSVDISFAIRSQIEELALETPVRIYISGAPEDHGHYSIEIEPKQLPGVTVEARSEVIDLIRRGDATVVAELRLKSTEKDARIESKAVSCFLAYLPDGTAVPVTASIEGSDAPPMVQLIIAPLDGTPE